MTLVFSGVQPTQSGVPHLGNLLGAILPAVRMQESHPTMLCVVDLHATTVRHDAAGLRAAVLHTASALLACGANPDTTPVFQQSHVPAHAQLFVTFLHLAHVGQMEAMTQYKDKSRNSQEIPFGILSYPALMAADILAYHSTHVPVGRDQHQHLQLAQMLARRFNHRFCPDAPYFQEPQAIFPAHPASIMSLRNPARKMSKSEPEGCVFLDDPMEVVQKKIRRAVSDADMLPSHPDGLIERPAATSLVGMLASLTDTSPEAVCQNVGGQGFSVLKARLIEAYEARILPYQGELHRRRNDLAAVRAVLDQGAAAAHARSQVTVLDVARLTGTS